MKACVFVFNGVEPIECFTTVDVLVRAGFDVTITSVFDEKTIHGAFGINIVPSRTLDQVMQEHFNVVVFPGGPGSNSEEIWGNRNLHRFMRQHNEQKAIIGSICAGTLTPAHAGIFQQKSVTSWPGVKEQILQHCGTYQDDLPSVVDGNIITSKGPGTAMHFALMIVKQTKGVDAVKSLGKQLLVPDCVMRATGVQ
ncbi:hypothetical protein RCL1_004163 [Eukaryota sp. TZLM3-RCL]